MSSLPPPPGRKATSSTISTSPLDNQDDDAPQHPGFISMSSAPSSPHSDKKHFPLTTKIQSKPPGLISTSSPSAISKPGHSKDSSATSPLLTLTPNSSVDGAAEWIGTTRTSPFLAGDGPAIPYISMEGRRTQLDDVVSNFSSLDLSESGNDGLLGLDALHQRSNSMQGPSLQSNSPPVSVSSRNYYLSHNTVQQSEFERPRSSRDRPPLSNAGNPFSISSNRSIGEANNSSMESSDSRGFGAIGRPELRLSAVEYEPNRRRSSSQDNLQNPYYPHQQAIPDLLSSKFRAMPSLTAQIHHQQKRMSENYSEVQKIRHVRSISQPGPPMSSSADQNFQSATDPHFFSYQPHSYSDQASFKPSRSASLSHSGLPPSFDGMQYDSHGSSMPNLNNALGYGGFSSTQRRDVLDFHQNLGGYPMADDMHSFGASGQSPYNVNYGGHIRQASEGALLSPAALSIGSNVIHGHSTSYGIHAGLDDDLADALAGEHIDFPDHDDPHGQGIPDTYFLNQAGSHPLLRTATHSHSMSLDAIPSSQYIDPVHHRPTAGGSMQVPKLVYAVKFKRSQRNFVLGPRISRDLKIGTYVKVEADRGEDLGIVVGKVAAEKYSFSARASFSAGIGPPPSLGSTATDLKRIIRLATHDEVSLLSLKREEEEELLKICRRKVRERCLPMNVVDAEYQFDRHKLTFFFEAEGRVDFRELVRDLFSMYKTRIWMQQLDKNTSTSAQAITSPQVGHLQMDYGTPIIAPPSEFADSIILNGLAGFDSRP